MLYAIIIYIVIIGVLIIVKPDFIYDHKGSKFRKFGYTKDETMFPISILSVFIAVAIAILFSLIGNSDNIDIHHNMMPIPHQIVQPVQTIPNIIYQPIPIQQLLPTQQPPRQFQAQQSQIQTPIQQLQVQQSQIHPSQTQQSQI